MAPLSAWTCSQAKRCFDVVLALAALAITAPLCLLISILVPSGSPGPVFFVQKRVGRHGRLFSILKFRTMVHRRAAGAGSITTINNDGITAVGRLLRRWKLDELPQLVNVLRGDMSLVGPRPRVPEQPTELVACRPGITGAASLAFAREELLLAAIPRRHLDSYYACRVLPLKQRLDERYMARATFFSDLGLIFRTVLRVWVAPGHSRRAVTLAPDWLAQDRHGSMGDPLPGGSCD